LWTARGEDLESDFLAGFVLPVFRATGFAWSVAAWAGREAQVATYHARARTIALSFSDKLANTDAEPELAASVHVVGGLSVSLAWICYELWKRKKPPV
jgi:hypothetical protein